MQLQLAPCRLSRRGYSIVRTALAAAAVACGCIAGCVAPPAARAVAEQNRANLDAFTANVALLGESTRALAEAQSDAVVRRAREHTAGALILLRTTITPDTPTPTELADLSTPWARDLADRAVALRARIDSAPPGDRLAIAAALATANADSVDLALATPGFDPARVLKDAVHLDDLNTRIDSEPAPEVRAALLAQRDSLLDPYLPVRLANDASARARASLDEMLARLDEQSRVATLHAHALADFTASNSPDAHGTTTSTGASLLSIYRDEQLRAAILDLVRDSAGDAAASKLRDRLTRLDAALPAP